MSNIQIKEQNHRTPLDEEEKDTTGLLTILSDKGGDKEKYVEVQVAVGTLGDLGNFGTDVEVSDQKESGKASW